MQCVIKPFLMLLSLAAFLSGCAGIEPPLAKRVAQPDNRPVRNFTSFTTALRCVDNQLAKAGKRRTLISSTGIPDLTGELDVGGDEMLVNAISQINRRSGAYIFMDQSLERASGQISILTTRGEKKEPRPNLYFRGAITQVDTNVVSDTAEVELDVTNVIEPPRISGFPLGNTTRKAGRGVSIVSVDMHLVGFPSRRVLPGGSVANSMVVVSDGNGFGGTGEINLVGIELTLSISRVESMGQAVRNLIELGVIELLGRHAGVPYWECLATRPSNEEATNGKFVEFQSIPQGEKFRQVQTMLTRLGYYDGPITTWMDPLTRNAIARFQADEKLIATGNLDFDLWERLRERTLGIPVETTAPLRALVSPPPANGAIRLPSQAKGEMVVITQAKPGLPAGTIVTNTTTDLIMKPSKDTYRVGDVFKADLRAIIKGAVACFHQSDNGPITQILPMNPKDAMHYRDGTQTPVPLLQDKFDIRFEKAGVSEAMLCVLDPSRNPPVTGETLGATGPLKPTKYRNFDDVVKAYQKSSRRVRWSLIRAVPK